MLCQQKEQEGAPAFSSTHGLHDLYMDEGADGSGAWSSSDKACTQSMRPSPNIILGHPGAVRKVNSYCSTLTVASTCTAHRHDRRKAPHLPCCSCWGQQLQQAQRRQASRPTETAHTRSTGLCTQTETTAAATPAALFAPITQRPPQPAAVGGSGRVNQGWCCVARTRGRC